jgi:hypothetical protein
MLHQGGHLPLAQTGGGKVKQYITEPADITAIRNGEGKLGGKQILVVGSDMKTATKRVFRALSANPQLALTGRGLSIKAIHGEWRKISLAEFKALVLDKFVLVKEQVGGGGRTRFEVLADVPSPFWLPTLMQGRWVDSEVQTWFPVQATGEVSAP